MIGTRNTTINSKGTQLGKGDYDYLTEYGDFSTISTV